MKLFKLNKLLLALLCVAFVTLWFVDWRQPSGNRVVNKPLEIQADESGHFFGHLFVNGVALRFIVDGGASHLTLNSVDAIKANIDYTKGELVNLTTPNGDVQAFSLMLNGVLIGPAVLNGIKVTVIEGGSPPYALLGMSAQRKLDVKRDNLIMTLGVKH